MSGARKPGRIGAVVSELGIAIVSGEIAPGETLPAEPDLEARYGVSRGVVREAVKILAAKSLVSVGPRHGTRVRPRQDWSLLDSDVLGWMAAGGGLEPALLAALEETRTVIEPAAAALAASRATAEDLARIAAALVAMEAGREDRVAAIKADKQFHLAILDATHNPVLASFRSAYDAIMDALFDVTVGGFVGNLPNHRAVAAAIAARDPEGARRAMERVLDFTQDLLVTAGLPAVPASPEKAA